MSDSTAMNKAADSPFVADPSADGSGLAETTDPQILVDGLAQLVLKPAAISLLPDTTKAPVNATPLHWMSPEAPLDVVDAFCEAVNAQLASEGPLGFVQLAEHPDWTAWVEPVRMDHGPGIGALVALRESHTPWDDAEISTIRVFATMCGTHWARQTAEFQRSLDELVTHVAERLMVASSSTLQETFDWTIATLAEFIHSDVAFYRRNDRAADVSILVAEYPKRTEIPDPDPLAVVPFDADPIFAMTRDLKEPFVSGSTRTPTSYNKRINDSRSIANFTGAGVPLIHDGQTQGLLAFIYFSECQLTIPEINALQAVASMLVQLNARIEAEEKLKQIALHDDLTGLPNRRAVLEEIDRRLADHSGQTALLFLDLDRFKFMNDYLGHVAGDRVLLTVADRIRMSIRPSDYAARLGGDEFVILMDGSEGELGSVATANRLIELVSRPIEVNGQHVSHTASVGIALAGDPGMTGVEMLGHADVALYAAKTQGRNRAVVFDDLLRLEVAERTNTEMMLREAIDNGGLRLFYQPEFDLLTGQILAVEALIRCEHPETGIVPAGQFIAVAEETGLVVDLGRWVLEEACRQMAIWRERYPGIDMIMRVNMSPAQLSTPGIVDHISRCLRTSNLLGSSLCLEITEHAVMQDIDRALGILNEFRSLGVRLALDDFGTGFSSMTQLKRLPINTLKVDMSFVIGLAKDPADQAIVESIVHLSEAFGLELVGEGVESLADMAELVRLGCHRAQGFLLSRPLPAAELDPLLWRGGIDLSQLPGVMLPA
jgi:diguanylate cyclase (GGDEF)-like protein